RVRTGGGDDEASAAVVLAVRPVTPPPPRGDQRTEVARGPAADEHAAGRRWETHEVRDPAQRLVLGVYRAGALQPRPGVDARRPDDEVEQHRRLGRGGGYERQEP